MVPTQRAAVCFLAFRRRYADIDLSWSHAILVTMSEVFFIADTHFNHKRIVEIREKEPGGKFASIDEHDEELVRRWNATVGKKDTVWHLGDFGVKGDSRSRGIDHTRGSRHAEHLPALAHSIARRRQDRIPEGWHPSPGTLRVPNGLQKAGASRTSCGTERTGCLRPGDRDLIRGDIRGLLRRKCSLYAPGLDGHVSPPVNFGAKELVPLSLSC